MKKILRILSYILFLLISFEKVFSQAPANDAICNAISLTSGAGCTQGTNVNSTAGTPAVPTCFAGGTVSNDVWYSFVATSTSMFVNLDVTGFTLTDSQVAVYSSSTNTCSGTLTQVGCDEDAGVNCALCANASVNNLVVGNTYFVRVDGFSTNVGTFCINVGNLIVQGNSPCNAQVLWPSSSACSIANGNQGYNATLPTANYAPIGTNYCGCDNETGQYGTWTTFTAPTSGTYTVTNLTAGANSEDMDYTLFSGTCTSLNCISCAQGTVSGGGKGTAIFTGLTAGTTYFVLSTLQNGDVSVPFRTDLCIRAPTFTCTPPSNNNCSGAISVNANTTYTASTYCATADGTLCSGSMENNIWYSWTVPSNWTGNAYFQMFNQNCNAGDISNGSQLSVYTAGQTCLPTASCATSSNTGSDANVNTYWTPTAGATYLITFDGNAGEVCNLSFQITNTAAIVLAVEYLSFDAKLKDGNVLLDWKTATEENNALFEVQRSVDGINFKTIGTVSGNYNSQTIQEYKFTDYEPELGFNYYRLKQVDINGTTSYSMIREVNVGGTDLIFTLKPNPTQNTVTLGYNCDKEELIAFQVSDANGRILYSKNASCAKGNNSHAIDLANFPDGLYLITLISQEKVYRSKLIKQD